MEGISHAQFRHLMVAKGGLDLVCTEFVRITKNPVSETRLQREVERSGSCPLSVQVMGNDAERMADAARIVSRAGADAVDINLGCPMPRVVRKGVGAAMLKDPDLLGQVLSAMRAVCPRLLSAKIRAGFDDKEGVVQIARVVQDAGVDYIAVHPRRRCDFYAGIADWRIIRTLKEQLSIPVVGNGDVWYASDAIRMMTETGCDAVMIGRPALRNPWIFTQIQALRLGQEPFVPDGAAVADYILEVADLYRRKRAGARRGPVGPLKEMLTWLGRSVDDEGEFRKKVLRLPTVDEILVFTETTLRSLPSSRIDLGPYPLHSENPLEKSGSAIVAAADPEDARVTKRHAS